MTSHKNSLANGTVIHQYQIESIIAHGGFGIVYKARHTHLDEAVVIKEYLPSEIATREGTTVHPLSNQEQDDYQDGLNRFLDEAKQLVQFKQHPNIVSCRDFFAENGTAYLVMDYEEGLSLSELLKARKNEPLSEEHLVRMMLSLLDGLKLVHEKGVLHRDIKLGNIFIRREDEEPVLIDFGAAKQNYSKHSKSMAPYTIGYAPMEQVSEEGNLGPWTDIYAVGAVMWRIISGKNPVDVNKRLTAVIKRKPDPFISASEVGAENYSSDLLNIIDKCVQLDEDDRYQSVEELISAIKDSQDINASPIEDSTSTEQLQSYDGIPLFHEGIKPSFTEDENKSFSKPIIPMKAIGLVAGLMLFIGVGIALNNYIKEQAVLTAIEKIKAERIAQAEAARIKEERIKAAKIIAEKTAKEEAARKYREIQAANEAYAKKQAKRFAKEKARARKLKKIHTVKESTGVYKGQLKNGNKHGKGTYTWKGGDKYIGQWKNNKMHGRGTYYYKNKGKYVGQWKNHKRYGKGTSYYKNGDKFTSKGWRDSSNASWGTYKFKDGTIEKSKLVNNKWING